MMAPAGRTFLFITKNLHYSHGVVHYNDLSLIELSSFARVSELRTVHSTESANSHQTWGIMLSLSGRRSVKLLPRYVAQSQLQKTFATSTVCAGKAKNRDITMKEDSSVYLTELDKVAYVPEVTTRYPLGEIDAYFTVCPRIRLWILTARS